jgi:UDPglucose--hexose-1-phosphate uridylyltransferase
LVIAATSHRRAGLRNREVDFPKTVISREILRPPAFEKDVHYVEFREDPLTGRRCRLNARRAGRMKQAQPTAIPVEVVGNREGCPFCPENIDGTVPKFDPGFYPGGRIRQGQCILFPNMFPLARHHVAATLCTSHFLDLDGFSAKMVIDAVTAAREFLLLVHKHDPDARYPMLHWNHLPPSAASVVHPHIQVLADVRPTSYQDTLLETSRQYYGRVGRSFWGDILDDEGSRGERLIGENESVAALASFAPQGNREVQIVFKGTSNLTDLQDRDIAGFADCVVRLLRGYKAMGVNSFNMSTFSAAMGERLDYYSLHAKLISRPTLQPFYRNDTGILERFHHEADIEVMPEAFAESARQSWGR